MALALPENGQVIQGNVQIAQPQNHILQILQSSPTGIINWGSFNIDANQLVQFLQPGANSALLNRVIGQDPSQILGQIQANGRILLVNPNGILFGPGSSVNAGSFLATTLSIQDQDFIQGRYDLKQDPNSPLRAVVNQGEIRVTDGGFIALVSPLVDNQGLLIAQQGQVVLGATTQATLQVDARGLLQVSIPDGFRGQSANATNPQTVLLTQSQMSDTLAQLVRGGHAEGERIVETAQGVQLVGAEGLLVNQGTIRSDAGKVLMDSSQATVNAPGSLVSVSSQGNAGEIRVFSAGSAVQMGDLAAASQAGNGGFIEVSGRQVHLTQAPDLSAPQGQAGSFLIDPEFVHIVNGTGVNPTFPVLENSAPTPGTLFINASALDTAGAVRVEAQRDLVIEADVDILLTQLTQLTLQAVGGNLEMGDRSSITATNPATTITLLAGNTATVRDISAANLTVTAGDRVNLLAGQLGAPGQNNVLRVNAPQIFTEAGRQIDVVGNSANVTLNASQSVVFDTGSTFNMASTTGYLNANGDTGGVNLFDNSNVRLTGTGNITFQSNGAGPDTGVFLQPGSELRMDGASNITFDTNGFVLGLGTIRAEAPPSTLTVRDGTGTQVSNVNVPTMDFSSPTFIQFLTGNLGVAGAATSTVLTANAPSISFATGSEVHILGDHSQVELTSPGDFGFFEGSKVYLDNGTANFTITSSDGGFMRPDTLLRASGAANITFNSSGADLDLGDVSATRVNAPSSIEVIGPGNISLNNQGGNLNLFNGTRLTLGSGNISLSNADRNIVVERNANLRLNGAGNVTATADHGNVDFRSGSNVTAVDPTSEVNMLAGKDVFLGDIEASNISATGNQTLGLVGFNGGTLGAAGRDTKIKVSGKDIFFFGTTPVTLVGTRVRLDLEGHGNANLLGTSGIRSQATNRTDANITLDGNLQMSAGSQIQTSGVGNVSVRANEIRMDPGSLISLAGAGSELTMDSLTALTTADLAVPTIDLHSGTDLFFSGGTIGRDGMDTLLTSRSDSRTFYTAGAPIRLVGNRVNYSQTSAANVIFASASDLRFDGSISNNVTIASSTNIRSDSGARISGAAPTRFVLNAPSNVTLDASQVNLANSGSNISIQAGGAIRLNEVTTGTFNASATAGNVRIAGAVEANDLTITTPNEIIRDGTSTSPALVAHNLLNLTASQMSGPVNVPSANLVQGFPIATDGTTLVRLNITGTNSTVQGNKAANIFYYFPQSGNVQVTNPNGEVLVYNQPNPNPPVPPVAPPPSAPRGIATRQDLSSAQFVELTNQAAQSQIQLSNLYSAAYLPSTSSVLMLGYNNIGLTHFAPVPLSTPLLELAVVDPAEASQERARSSSQPDGTAATGTSPRTDGTGTTTGSTGTTGSTATTGTTGPTTTSGTGLPGRGDTPTVETGVLSPESSATGTRNRENSVREDQANSMVLAGNDEDEELRYWRRLIEGFIIWEE